MNDDPEEDIPEEIKAVIKMLNDRKKLDDEIKEEAEKSTEENEKKIMMNLWSDIDNNTESYAYAFQAITGYTIMVKSFRKKMKYVHPSVRSIIANAFIKQIQEDIEFTTRIDSIREKFE
jgi:hypothetical protein